jgi:protein transport protein YIF1
VSFHLIKNDICLLIYYLNKEWSLKSIQEEPVPPKFDVNAPDMYIPLMSFVTYILFVGLTLGTQNKFSPEILGMQASSALCWFILELFIIFVSLQVLAIKSALSTFDIIAFCGYKYFG